MYVRWFCTLVLLRCRSCQVTVDGQYDQQVKLIQNSNSGKAHIFILYLIENFIEVANRGSHISECVECKRFTFDSPLSFEIKYKDCNKQR